MCCVSTAVDWAAVGSRPTLAEELSHRPLSAQTLYRRSSQEGGQRWQVRHSRVYTFSCSFVTIPFCKHLFSFRVLLDRTSSDLDRALRHLDPDMFYPSSDSRVPDFPVHTNTNSHTFSTSSPQCSLTQLLSDIKACRWKFFRPRPVQDNSRGDDKKGTRQVEKSGVSPLSNGVSGEGFILYSRTVQKPSCLHHDYCAVFKNCG